MFSLFQSSSCERFIYVALQHQFNNHISKAIWEILILISNPTYHFLNSPCKWASLFLHSISWWQKLDFP